jgi:hypothetical protein
MNPEQIARILIVRFLLLQAKNQLNLSASLRPSALLSMHDAIEMFLDTASEAKQIPLSNKTNLQEYWRLFANANPPIALPAQRAVDRLNRARVNLKHHGILPTDEQLRDYLDITETFLNDTCTLCFGIPIHSVSLVQIVRNDEVRNLLEAAKQAIAERRLSDAGADVAKAFTVSLGMIDESMRSKGLRVSLPVLGVDFHYYERFKSLTPNVQQSVSGKRMVAWHNAIPCEDADQVQWCIDFVADFMVRVEARAAGLMG